MRQQRIGVNCVDIFLVTGKHKQPAVQALLLCFAAQLDDVVAFTLAF